MKLNQITKGWANYHHCVCAKDTFSLINHILWEMLWKWAKRRHPQKSNKWIKKRYWHTKGNRQWSFRTEKVTLFQMMDTPIVRIKSLELKKDPYLDSSLEAWKDTILFIETSEDKPLPDFIKWTFRNLAAQGILKVIKGIVVGKPQGEKYYEEYKTAITQVVVNEENLDTLPIFYNVNFGHAKPIGIIPYGIVAKLNCKNKTIVLLECPTV